MSLSSPERRKRLRSAKTSLPVVHVRYLLRNGEAAPVRVTIANLTEQGCGLESNTPLDTGSQITIEGDLAGRGIETSVVARVAWCRAKGGGIYRAGVEFVDPPQIGYGAGLWGRARSAAAVPLPPGADAIPGETPEQRAAAEQALRRQILGLLYHCRANAPDPGELPVVELERHLGLSRSQIEFSLWYLRESGLAERSARGGYGITIRGVDHVEMSLVRPD